MTTTTLTVKQRFGQWFIPKLPITRFLFDQIRVEINAQLMGLRNKLVPARRRRIAELRRQRELIVNVVCGPQVLPGFVNIDLFPCRPEVVGWDCRRSLPFSDDSVRGIRVEQFVEHLETREELPSFLQECRRVLSPGGVLRVIVPDAERYLRAYCRPDDQGFRELAVPDPFPHDLPTRMDIINHVFHQWQEHRWGYDFETLAHRLKTAGFGHIDLSSFQRSLDPQLAVDLDIHAPYSLYVDAVKGKPVHRDARQEHALCAGLLTPHTMGPKVSQISGDLRSSNSARSGDLRRAPSADISACIE